MTRIKSHSRGTESFSSIEVNANDSTPAVEIKQFGSGALLKMQDSTGTTVPQSFFASALIAASDTPAAERKYVADLESAGAYGDRYKVTSGSTTQTTINTAIVAVGDNGGGDVVLLPGTYEVSLGGNAYAILINKSNVRLVILPGATVKLADSQLDIGAGTEGNIIRVGDEAASGPSNVHIIGHGIIDGNKANQTGTRAGKASAAVYFSGELTDCTLEAVTIQNHIGDALWAEGVDDTDAIVNLKILSPTVRDVWEGFVWQFAKHVQVRGGYWENMEGQDAIEPARGAKYWIIDSNEINGTQQSGIDVFDDAQYGRVTNNTVRDAAQTSENGIGIGSTTTRRTRHILVAYNTVENTTAGQDAINVRTTGQGAGSDNSDIKILHNQIDGGVRGVHVASNDSENIEIAFNCIDNVTQNGILGRGLGLSIKNNWVKGSGLQNIEVETGATNVDIDDNTVLESDRSGIFSKGTNVSIKGNRVYNNNQGDNGNIGGIRINGGDRHYIRLSQIYDTQGTPTQDNGIYPQSGTNIVIELNEIWGQSGDAVFAPVSGTVIRLNQGHATEASGTATIPDGSTSVSVTHGLDETPGAKDISITPTNDLGAAAKWWISNVGASTFDINVDINPGSATATFAWQGQII